MFSRFFRKNPPPTPINLAKARLVAAEKTLEKLKARPDDVRVHDQKATAAEINHFIQVWTRNVEDFRAQLEWLQ